MNHIIETIINYIIAFITSIGYLGILGCMTLESACIPVPSEIVLIFSGYLVSQGEFHLLVAIFVATVGSLIGASIAYLVGYYGGKPLLLRFGKYIFITPKRLDLADRWFQKHGSKAVFICRLLFGLRALISLPAGVTRLKYRYFALYTFFGAFMWCSAGVLIGRLLGSLVENWRHIADNLHKFSISITVLVILIVAILIFLYYRRKRTT